MSGGKGPSGLSLVAFRCWVSGAESVSVSGAEIQAVRDADEHPGASEPECFGLKEVQLVRAPVPEGSPAWLFEGAFELEGEADTNELLRRSLSYQLQVQYAGGGDSTLRDPWSMGALIKHDSLEAWSTGEPCEPVFSTFGAHHMELRPEVWGTRFAVWAPNAHSVSVVGDWNFWDAKAHPMCRRDPFGVWELFLPAWDLRGNNYAYSILPEGSDSRLVKTDPCSIEQVDPSDGGHDAKVPECDDFSRAFWGGAYGWGDADWMKQRAEKFSPDAWSSHPMSIYEVHLPTWGARQDGQGRRRGYRELAEPLADYVESLGFTTVELLPVSQYPADMSWGYQCAAGLYAVDARLGSPDDFRFLVDTLHRRSISVFVDFVGAHFAKDDWGLVQYSGAPQYEYEGAMGDLPGWGTARFNYSCPKVRSYLRGAADYWLGELHVDGLRLDAVAAMVYSSFGREEDGDAILAGRGVVNQDGVKFLREFCAHVREAHPGVILSAEESTNFKWVTERHSEAGTERQEKPHEDLGFHLKWNMGFAFDALEFMKAEAARRPHLETFGWKKLAWYLAYAFNERWVLPFSHDNAHSTCLLDQMTAPGEANTEVQLDMTKILLTYMVGMPGRPLLFMGAEVGAPAWTHERPYEWSKLEADEHRQGLRAWVSRMLHLYRELPALHRQDDDKVGFEWLDMDSAGRCIMAWRRQAKGEDDVLVLVNFSSASDSGYQVNVGRERAKLWRCVAHTSADTNEMVAETSPEGILCVDMPACSAMIWRPEVEKPCAVTFDILSVEVESGWQLRVVGSRPELGEWRPEAGLLLSSTSDAPSRWRGEVDIAGRGCVEFKYVIVKPDAATIWEGMANNRSLNLALHPMVVRTSAWEQSE